MFEFNPVGEIKVIISSAHPIQEAFKPIICNNPPEVVIQMHVGDKIAQYELEGANYPDWMLRSGQIMKADLHIPSKKNIDINAVTAHKSKESDANTLIIIIKTNADIKSLTLKGKVL